MSGQTTIDDLRLRLIPVGEEIEIVIKKNGRVIDYADLSRQSKNKFIIYLVRDRFEIEGDKPSKALRAVKRRLKEYFELGKKTETDDEDLAQDILNYIGDVEGWVLTYEVFKAVGASWEEFKDALDRLLDAGEIDVAGGITPPPVPASFATMRRIR